MGVFTLRPKSLESIEPLVKLHGSRGIRVGMTMYVPSIEGYAYSMFDQKQVFSLRKNVKGEAKKAIADEIGYITPSRDINEAALAVVHVPVWDRRMPFPDTESVNVVLESEATRSKYADSAWCVRAIAKAVYNFVNAVHDPAEANAVESIYLQHELRVENTIAMLDKLHRREQ